MNRMEEEAEELGADGVVGVRLDVNYYEWGNDSAEFIAFGTAVKAEDGTSYRNALGKPFTSDLSGQDFWTLMQTGPRPAGPRHGDLRLPHRAPQADPGARLHGAERRTAQLHPGALRGAGARHDAHAGRGGPARTPAASWACAWRRSRTSGARTPSSSWRSAPPSPRRAARSRCPSRPPSSRSTTDARAGTARCGQPAARCRDEPRPAARRRPARGGRPPAGVHGLLLRPHRARLRGLPRSRAPAGRPRPGLLRHAVGLVRAGVGLHARHVALHRRCSRPRAPTRRSTAVPTATSPTSTGCGARTWSSPGSRRPGPRATARPTAACSRRPAPTARTVSSAWWTGSPTWPTPGRPSSTSSAPRSPSRAGRPPPAGCPGAPTWRGSG